MRKIANTTELTAELEQLLEYAGSYRPSRAKLASALYGLSQRVASKTYTCVADLDRRSTTERKADSAEKAAEAAAKASHGANYVKEDQGKKGKDSHGDYEEFTVMQGSRAKGSVRVYEDYK